MSLGYPTRKQRAATIPAHRLALGAALALAFMAAWLGPVIWLGIGWLSAAWLAGFPFAAGGRGGNSTHTTSERAAMNDTPSAPLPATLAAALRIFIAVIGPMGIARGWWGESDLANLTAMAVTLVTIGYGLYKTHDRQTRLVNSPAPIGRSTIR